VNVDIGELTTLVSVAPTNKVDVSLAIPVVTTNLSFYGRQSIARSPGNDPGYDPQRHTLPGNVENRDFSTQDQKTGLGDITGRVKVNVFQSARRAAAVGLDLRVPTGDAENLLGSGALGLRPFFIYSYAAGLVSPHLKLAYAWSGNSVLAGTLAGDSSGQISFDHGARLPQRWLAHVGADIALHPKATLSFEILGDYVTHHYNLVYFNAPCPDGSPGCIDNRYQLTSGFNTDASIGLKLNPTRTVLVDLNVLFNNYQTDFAVGSPHPSVLVGIEYGF
jgi:hypothetical protein